MDQAEDTAVNRRYGNDIEISVTVNDPLWAVRDLSMRIQYLEFQLSAVAIFVADQVIERANEKRDFFLQDRGDELMALLHSAEYSAAHCRRVAEATETSLVEATRPHTPTPIGKATQSLRKATGKAEA